MRRSLAKLISIFFIGLTIPIIQAQSVRDINGNVYKTVIIGAQTWMAENLKTTKLNDGMAIQSEKDSTRWTKLTAPAFCWYSNDEASNKNLYGALYNWYSVSSGNLCPIGWHIPDHSEWTILLDCLREKGEMKTPGILNETGHLSYIKGFMALPGGGRFRNGTFVTIGECSYWWSSSEINGEAKFVGYYDDGVERGSYEKYFGLSVRCLKD